MVQRVSTVAFEGIEARAVDVQVQVAPGLPAFAMVKTINAPSNNARAILIGSKSQEYLKFVEFRKPPLEAHHDFSDGLWLAVSNFLMNGALALAALVTSLTLTGSPAARKPA